MFTSLIVQIYIDDEMFEVGNNAYAAAARAVVKDAISLLFIFFKIQGNMKNGAIQVLVATKAFGMGINLPNIRYIISVGLPENLPCGFKSLDAVGETSIRCAFSERARISKENAVSHS